MPLLSQSISCLDFLLPCFLQLLCTLLSFPGRSCLLKNLPKWHKLYEMCILCKMQNNFYFFQHGCLKTKSLVCGFASISRMLHASLFLVHPLLHKCKRVCVGVEFAQTHTQKRIKTGVKQTQCVHRCNACIPEGKASIPPFVNLPASPSLHHDANALSLLFERPAPTDKTFQIRHIPSGFGVHC